MTTSSGQLQDGKPWSMVGTGFAVLAIFVFPVLLGCLGAAFGFVGYAKGERSTGIYVGLGAILAMFVGLALGYTMASR